MAATEPGPGQDAGSGVEPLAADLDAPPPRVSTRVLLTAVVVLAALLLVSAVVGFLVLRQPRLTPLPVPSVSSIA